MLLVTFTLADSFKVEVLQCLNYHTVYRFLLVFLISNLLAKFLLKSYDLFKDNNELNQCTVNSFITKTRLYNFDPFKPHFYIVKLGFTGVYIIFLISA